MNDHHLTVEILDAVGVEETECNVFVETYAPPRSRTLTYAAKSLHFVPPGTDPPRMLGSIRCSHPRLPDPCTQLPVRQYATPTEVEMRQVLHRMNALANVARLYAMSATLLSILDTEDGRVYDHLPGIVANRTMAYHHSDGHWLEGLKFKIRRGVRFRCCHRDSGSTFDENSNAAYPEWGVTAEMTERTPPAPEAFPDLADAPGIVMRNAERDICLTAPSHEWAKGTDAVLRPSEGVRYVGHIRDRIRELGVALVNLDGLNQPAFLKATAKARRPTRLLSFADAQVGDKFEVNAGPSGFVDVHCVGKFVDGPRPQQGGSTHKPLGSGKGYVLQPIGHRLIEGMEGAPVVNGEDGGVAGFLHLVSDIFAEITAVDVLIERGWEIVAHADT